MSENLETVGASDASTNIELPGTWSPIDRWFDHLHRQALSFWGPGAFVWGADDGAIDLLPTDVLDLGDRYEVRADVPGIPKERIDIRVQGDRLRIHAESAAEKETKQESYVRRERSFRAFERTFELPEPVSASSLRAQVVDGVLTVQIPKSKPVSEEKVPVA